MCSRSASFREGGPRGRDGGHFGEWAERVLHGLPAEWPRTDYGLVLSRKGHKEEDTVMRDGTRNYSVVIGRWGAQRRHLNEMLMFGNRR